MSNFFGPNRLGHMLRDKLRTGRNGTFSKIMSVPTRKAHEVPTTIAKPVQQGSRNEAAQAATHRAIASAAARAITKPTATRPAITAVTARQPSTIKPATPEPAPSPTLSVTDQIKALHVAGRIAPTGTKPR